MTGEKKPREKKVTRHIADPPQHTRMCSWLYDMDQARNTGDKELMTQALLEMPEPAAFTATLADLHDLYLHFLDSPHTYNVKQAINMVVALSRLTPPVSRRRAAQIVTADPAFAHMKATSLERRMKDNNGAYVVERIAATKTEDGRRFEEALKVQATIYLYHYGTEKELKKHTGMTRADVEAKHSRPVYEMKSESGDT